jgi:HlyD family secretion protein
MAKNRAEKPLFLQLFSAFTITVLGITLLVNCGCSRTSQAGWQGYLEGDFVYVASPLAGRLETLSVVKGSRVAPGTVLFTLEHESEAAALRQAAQERALAESQLADLRKGSRPEEIAGLEAHVAAARAAAELSRLELARQESLFRNGAISASDYDKARLGHEADVHAAEQFQAQLDTARLGGRPDAIAAAEAAAHAARDAEAHARWAVDQKTQVAGTQALVYDTLYREGEFVTAGNPVVSLLPPGNMKVRFFVDEPSLARVHAGQKVNVAVEGLAKPVSATVAYLSPSPEYTPPVLYNRDNRSKLVYMVEASVPAADAADLHPGQPVDVVPVEQ